MVISDHLEGFTVCLQFIITSFSCKKAVTDSCVSICRDEQFGDNLAD